MVLGFDTQLKLLGSVVSGISFLTGGVFECDIAHRRPVAVLCMLYKIRCNPMHPVYGAQNCESHWLHIGTLMRLLAAESRRTILVTPYSMVWDWRVSRAIQMRFYFD